MLWVSVVIGPSDDDTRAAREGEIARYRRAAQETLDQLQWAINYLYRIRKDRIAAALERNYRTIRREMRRPDDD
ncbi:MAG TPA: hypothetical protein VE620_06520 [Myxococcales bacterium]|nr:hypothetical protein [Myxococcales bacterium]